VQDEGHVGDEITFACLKAAKSYSSGESERTMGRAIKHFGWNRNGFVVPTKVYRCLPSDLHESSVWRIHHIHWGTCNSALPSLRNKINNLGLSRRHLIGGTETVLARLQLLYVDIMYAHCPDRQTPIEETVCAFNFLIDTDKALYWSTSEWLPSEIEEAWAAACRLGLIGPVVEQPGYSLLKVDEFKNANYLRGEGYASPYSHL